MKIKLIVDEYIGLFFYKRNSWGRWQRLGRIGNVGVALDVASMLRKLGHKVKIEDCSVEGED